MSARDRSERGVGVGIYLNQLPPTEVARLKAELAETLIANFCYPRFYDYRVGALRMRPVDRAKRQEVWQYLNAVDFNVWGRVDLDSPDFQRQIERLFIHFVQRNRNFFGEQGRKRMVDVRSLITSCSNLLASGLRGHLHGQPENPPFGSPRPIFSWSTTNITGRPEPVWEQILNGTMQLQQQLQEVRGEVRAASTPTPAMPVQSAPSTPSGPLAAPARTPANVPSRRSRPTRSVANGATNGNGSHEDESQNWSPQGNEQVRPSEGRIAVSFPAGSNALAAFPEFPARATSAEASPTMPLPLGKSDMPTAFQPTVTPEGVQSPSGRQKRVRPGMNQSAEAFVPTSSAGVLQKSISQPVSVPANSQAVQTMQTSAPVAPQQTETSVKTGESGTVLTSDEDVVIFEQMRRQLLVWLRVEAVRAGIDLGTLGSFQLVEVLRHQEGIDSASLQVVSTLLNMCDQIVKGGRATLFDYKQAMMFYLMHTQRSR
jgi:hypothetical protein